MKVRCMNDEAVTRYIIQERMTDVFCQVAKKEVGVEPVKEYQFHPERKWRFDYAFVEAKIALEVEGGVHTGGRHVRPKGFLNDMEKYNAAATMGWRLLRTTPDMLLSRRTTAMIKEAMNYGNNEETEY